MTGGQVSGQVWEWLAGPYLAAALLLVVAGVPKVADPMSLVRALRSAGLPARRQPVRALAVAEVALGVAAVLVPSRLTAAAVALGYLAFTGFVARVLRGGGVLGSCGCFGKPDTPATRTHLGLTGLMALAALALVLRPPPADAYATWTGSWPTLLALAGYAALLAFLGYLVLAVLPTVSAGAILSTRAVPVSKG